MSTMLQHLASTSRVRRCDERIPGVVLLRGVIIIIIIIMIMAILVMIILVIITLAGLIGVRNVAARLRTEQRTTLVTGLSTLRTSCDALAALTSSVAWRSASVFMFKNTMCYYLLFRRYLSCFCPVFCRCAASSMRAPIRARPGVTYGWID